MRLLEHAFLAALLVLWGQACNCGRRLMLAEHRCGNGVIDRGERCDDGASNGSYDHCGFDCSGSGPFCGDGAVDPGFEKCEPGLGDACQACLLDCGGFSTTSVCGDGIVCSATEACDDGPPNGTYGRCKSDCSGLGPRCGDGNVNAFDEVCEPGMGDPCHACLLDCSAYSATSVCGDGVVCYATESCDDGYQTACGPCNATCTGLGMGSTCGDGITCPDTESCDDGFTDACGSCDADCSDAGSGHVCGDGSACPELEACDEGADNGVGEGHCTATCLGLQICGNGDVEGTEACDDGNRDDCNGNCSSDCSRFVTITGCGDGVACAPEECDDGRNGDPCDGCLDACTIPNPPPGPTTAPTVIDGDTVWYGVQSPIVLATDVVVLPGSSLTACRGTVVQSTQGGNVALWVRGHLDVVGTEADPVVFTSGASSPAPGDWEGIRIQNSLGGSAAVRGATVEYATVALSTGCCYGAGPVSVVGSTFRNNGTGLGSDVDSLEWSVRDSRFLDNGIGAVAQQLSFYGCVFSGNDRAIDDGFMFAIFDSTITGNRVGIQGRLNLARPAPVEGCLIADNTEVGVRPRHQALQLLDDTIVRNGTGVLLDELMPMTNPSSIHESTLSDNASCDLELQTALSVDATGNWWGTTDPEVIETLIWDVYDDSNLGVATFEPLLSSPPPDAPPP